MYEEALWNSMCSDVYLHCALKNFYVRFVWALQKLGQHTLNKLKQTSETIASFIIVIPYVVCMMHK